MPRHLPCVLTPNEAAALLGAAQVGIDAAKTPAKLFAARRDLAMIWTTFLAGVRLAELCTLRIENIGFDVSMLHVIGGKGDKDRNIPLGEKLARILHEWIGDRKSGFLFPGPRAKKLNPSTFQRRLTKLGNAAKITKRVHPHQGRHHFATTLLRTGADLREVMELLGHNNLATTAIYLHVDTSRLKGAVDRL